MILKEPANKGACGTKERNEEHDSVNPSILLNWPGSPKAYPKIRAASLCLRVPKELSYKLLKHGQASAQS